MIGPRRGNRRCAACESLQKTKTGSSWIPRRLGDVLLNRYVCMYGVGAVRLACRVGSGQNIMQPRYHSSGRTSMPNKSAENVRLNAALRKAWFSATTCPHLLPYRKYELKNILSPCTKQSGIRTIQRRVRLPPTPPQLKTAQLSRPSSLRATSALNTCNGTEATFRPYPPAPGTFKGDLRLSPTRR